MTNVQYQTNNWRNQSDQIRHQMLPGFQLYFKILTKNSTYVNQVKIQIQTDSSLILTHICHFKFLTFVTLLSRTIVKLLSSCSWKLSSSPLTLKQQRYCQLKKCLDRGQSRWTQFWKVYHSNTPPAQFSCI